MKKVFFTIFLTFFSVICVNAQEIDSLQIKSDTISIETLAARLDKLQRDYNYLRCEYEFNKLHSELDSFSNKLDIKSNKLLIDCLSNRVFENDLYIANKTNYYKSVELFNSTKEKIESVKVFVALTTLSSNFSKEELSVLDYSRIHIDNQVRLVENSLDFYKFVIDWYKERE